MSLKKLILIILFFSFATSNIISQNIIIKDLNDTDISNGTITIDGNITDELIEMGLKVTNNGSSSLNIKVKKEEEVIIDGSENYFCWGDCFIPEVFVSPQSITIDAGATNSNGFKGDYKPKGLSGQSKIRYTFFNADNETEASSVLVIFNISSSTKVNNIEYGGEYLSKVYPVPSKEYVTIKYNLENANNIKLQIYNILGSNKENIIINKAVGEHKIFSDNYKSGIYLYKFTQNGYVIDSGRFIFN